MEGKRVNELWLSQCLRHAIKSAYTRHFKRVGRRRPTCTIDSRGRWHGKRERDAQNPYYPTMPTRKKSVPIFYSPFPSWLSYQLDLLNIHSRREECHPSLFSWVSRATSSLLKKYLNFSYPHVNKYETFPFTHGGQREKRTQTLPTSTTGRDRHTTKLPQAEIEGNSNLRSSLIVGSSGQMGNR